MGQVLVIKNADFSKNKLAVVSFVTPVHCTGITLNNSTLSMTHLFSTAQLTPTITPTGVTDPIIWSSSNNNVVSVADGIVKQQGVGTAIITARCGNYSAECTVTAVNILQYTIMKTGLMYNSNSTYDYCWLNYQGDAYYAAVYSLSPVTKYGCVNDDFSSYPHELVYPLLFGKNATTINVTAPSNVKVTHLQLNSEEMCIRGQTYPDYNKCRYARLISKDANAYSSNIDNGNRTITISEGADSAVFNFRGQNGSLPDTDLAQITITIS